MSLAAPLQDETPQPAPYRPEPEASDLSEYEIASRVEIIGLLRTLQDRRVLVIVHFDAGAASVSTLVLAVNPEFEEVVLDSPADQRRRAQLFASNGLVAVSLLDRVKVQFRAARAEPTTFEGQPAFRVRLPDTVLRLQRRNFFRAKTPSVRPLILQLPPLERGGTPRQLRVADLSCGGIGAVANKADGLLEPGAEFDGCRIELPEIGPITFALELRYVARLARDGAANLRCGFQFLHLAPQIATQLQRYINQLERAQIAARD